MQISYRRIAKQSLLLCLLLTAAILISCKKDDTPTNPNISPNISSGDNPGTINPATDPTDVVRVIQIQGSTEVDHTPPTSTSNGATPEVQPTTSSYAQIQQGQSYDFVLLFSDNQGDVNTCIVTAEGASNYVRINIPSPQQPGSLNEITVPIMFPNAIRPGVINIEASLSDAMGNVSSYVSVDIIIGAPIPGDDRKLIVGTWSVVQVVNLSSSVIGKTLIFGSNGMATDVDGSQYTYTITGTEISFSSGVVYDIIALNQTNLIINEVGGLGRYANLRRTTNLAMIFPQKEMNLFNCRKKDLSAFVTMFGKKGSWP